MTESPKPETPQKQRSVSVQDHMNNNSNIEIDSKSVERTILTPINNDDSEDSQVIKYSQTISPEQTEQQNENDLQGKDQNISINLLIDNSKVFKSDQEKSFERLTLKNQTHNVRGKNIVTVINKKNSQLSLEKNNNLELIRKNYGKSSAKSKNKKKSKNKNKKNKISNNKLLPLLPRCNSGDAFQSNQNADESTIVQKDRYQQNQINFYKQNQRGEEGYDLQIFDNIDSVIVRQQEYINKNKQNYERTLVKLYKLDSLKSQKAQDIISELNRTGQLKTKQVREQKQGNTPSGNKLQTMQKIFFQQISDRNQSLPSRTHLNVDPVTKKKQIAQKVNQSSQNHLIVDIQNQLGKITEDMNVFIIIFMLKKQHQLSFEEVRTKPEFNRSIFRFEKNSQTRLCVDEWERLTLNPEFTKIKSKISNFDQELEKVNQMQNRNDNCIIRYLEVQKDLMSYKQRIANQIRSDQPKQISQ